jgi:anthranilate phosphoribosyltransferase
VKSKGQTIEESAQMFTNIISGNGTEAQNNVVCANAEWPSQRQRNVHRSGFQIAKESLISGKGLKALTTLQELSKQTTPKGELG